ncbi:MAG: hypothetical protein ACN4GZ_19075 [Acidimicrobiales bacterium]
MALSPEQFEVQEFTVAFRGWKKEEVTAFLKRAATEMRELQLLLDTARADVEEAKRSKEAAIAAAAQLPVPPALAPTQADQDDADKFNELGDRIAGLLRTAEESAEKIKAEAEVDAEEMKSLAETEAEELKAEAEKVLEDARAEAEKIRADAQAEADSVTAELEDARSALDAELAETREAAETDRKDAQSALADAQTEVAELLAEARSQSEFIRQEADEIVRVKVRTDMDTAEKRMRILQLTEQSSRDRLVAAQAELNAALDKLEAEPSPELAAIEADDVLSEARDRATRELTGGGKASPFYTNSLDEVFEPQFYENPDESGEDDDTDVIDVDADDVVEVDLADDQTDDDLEYDDDVSAEVDDDDLDDDGEDDDVSAEVDDDDLDEDDDDDDVSAEVDDDDLDEDDDDDDDSIGSKYEEAYGFSTPVEDDAFDAQEVMDETPGVVIDDSISSLPDDDQSPLDSVEVPDDSGRLLDDELVPSVPTAPVDNAVPAALAGKAPAPPANETESTVLSEEDPLAKLVREAMQRAVDNARGEEV